MENAHSVAPARLLSVAGDSAAQLGAVAVDLFLVDFAQEQLVALEDRLLVRLVGAGWLAFGVPHLAYHAAHLAHLGRLDRALNLAALGGTVLAAAALCLPPRRVRPAPVTISPPGPSAP